MGQKMPTNDREDLIFFTNLTQWTNMSQWNP